MLLPRAQSLYFVSDFALTAGLVQGIRNKEPGGRWSLVEPPNFSAPRLQFAISGKWIYKARPAEKKRGAPKPPIPPARGRFLGEFPGVRQGKRLDAGA